MTIGKYNVIYADPPWRYAQKGLQGAAERHYPTMGIEELCALPVADLAAPDSVLFLWATFPQLPEALRLIKAWGFQYKSVGFVWLKKNKKADSWFYGLGFWTRANAEVCLLATRGHPRRKAPNVHQFIISPIEGHSKKPDEAREKIVALMGDVPRVELFARQTAPGWDVWGNEVEPTAGLQNFGAPQSRQTLWGEEAQRNGASFGTKCPEVSRVKFVPTSPKERRLEMPYVNVPNDLSKIKTKIAFNLTKRQLVCFGGAALVGVPSYLLARNTFGNTAALFLMLGIMLPAFLLAMYEKDGLPLEKVVKNIIRAKYLRPGVRPYKTGNIYAPFTGQAGKEAVNGKPKKQKKE